MPMAKSARKILSVTGGGAVGLPLGILINQGLERMNGVPLPAEVAGAGAPHAGNRAPGVWLGGTMGHIVADQSVSGNQGGRRAGSFKDGKFIRRIEIRPGNLIEFYTIEGVLLYQEVALAGQSFIITSLNAETSSFSGTVVLLLGGFTPETDNSRTITIVTDYQIAPPMWFGEG
jgi:hypothetical protein